MIGESSGLLDLRNSVKYLQRYGPFAVLMLLSLLVRLPNLKSPLMEQFGFRQTQTAITVWTFVEGGISLWNYQTPVFGSPWQMPFEFPLYQATAALLVKAGIRNPDVACRLANILYFYASAGILYRLVLRRSHDDAWPQCVALAYVWMPFGIFWSRTAMIDFCSVFFTLSYLLTLEEALTSERSSRYRALMCLLSIAAGSLAFMVKVTTVPIVLLPLAYCAVKSTVSLDSVAKHRFRLHVVPVIIVSTSVILPFLAGYVWTEDADHIRAALPAGRWLAASNLRGWNFGSNEQRLAKETWSLIGSRIATEVAPGCFVWLLPAAAILAGIRPLYRATVLAYTLSAFATIVIFINLYFVHNYYLMAVTPALALLFGSALHTMFFFSGRFTIARWPLVAVTIGGLYYIGQDYLKPMRTISYKIDQSVAIGRAIQKHTQENENIIIEDNDWSSDFLYYARRRGLMWRGSITNATSEKVLKLLRQGNYTLLLAKTSTPETVAYYDHYAVIDQVGPFQLYRVKVRGRDGTY